VTLSVYVEVLTQLNWPVNIGQHSVSGGKLDAELLIMSYK